MTDTGQIPGEGLPENAGMVEQPGIPAPDAYTFLDPSEHAPEDDDLLLMPTSQGAWSDPQQTAQAQPAPQAAAAPAAVAAPATAPVSVTAPEQAVQQYQAQRQPQVPAQGQEAPAAAEAVHGTHESGGRDTGSVDLDGVRIPSPATAPAETPVPVQTPAAVQAPAPVRRPLHRGPVSAEGPSYGGGTQGGGVVRSLADRGPAGAVRTAPPARHASPPVTGPEYFEAPAEEVPVLPGPQLGEIPPQGASPWGPPPEAPAEAPAEAEAEAVVEPEASVGSVDVVEPEPTVVSEVAAEPEPVVETVTVAEAEQPVVEPVAVAEAAVPVAPVEAEQPVAPEAEAPAEEAVPEHVEPEAPVEPVQPEAVVPAEPVQLEAAVEPEAAAPVPMEQPVQAKAVNEPEPVVVQPEPVVVQPEPVLVQPEPVEQMAPAETVVPEPVAAEPVVAEQPEGPVEAVVEAPAELPAEAPAKIPVAAPVEAPAAPADVTVESAPQPVLVDAPVADPAAVDEAVAAEEVPEPAAVTVEPVEPEPAAPQQTPEPATTAEPVQPAPAAEPVADAEDGTGPEVIETPELDEQPVEQPAAEVAPQEPFTPPAPGYDDAEREAVLRVMRERRDIRNGFRSDPIPHEVLLRVLEAAHTAPSVGHSQPWDFVVIRSAETRRSMHELAQRQREAYAQSLPKGRAKQFKELKIEAILDTPVNIVVTADPTRGGRHTLGRHTQPQMAPYSSALAVENLWLAARAEGLGVGWVSFFDEREMVRALGLPEHLEVVAYLCVGYVDEFPEEPELLQAGWSKRRPLSWVVHEETYGRRALPGEEPHDLLQETISAIRPLDAKALGEAWERQKRMTKPAGALGMLEIISAQLSGLSRMCPPPIPEPAAVAIFAGDHGVHAQGVTAWPQEVTAQMVANFLGGGAVCNAFAAQVGAEVCVVDVGVATDLPATPGLLPRKVRKGTSDFTTGPALTRDEVLAAIEVGIETARDLVAAGNKALLTGEMGIANTTASAALICVYTGSDASEVTGRGTGINDEMHARKVDVVRRALDLHQPDASDPIGVLAAVGGLEHAAMAGFLLGGASLRTPVILDGVSAGAAALVARAIAPEALAACIAGHRSAEPGHVAALNKLGLRPLVDLDLRLGEGTGALLALPIVQSAARAMHEVATFDAAGVTEK
ncbi:nicotinate-nucleotide--dimethylbenzimidazole phosphoribosyltransferase [Streptomyces sp. NPDC058011]|uniref:nicotinate-nucleotide--dimethylbenzimidazole phosphoribosyltransferase n=1 Tax=Streptomyces sp. NPDC058011 TaxID=3346305 RepID=UPI0036E940AE